MPILETSASCSVRIDNKEIKCDISSIQLDQYIDDHHTLQVRLRQVGKASNASDFDDPATYTSFLGKSLSLSIKPLGGVIDPSRELEFIGLVTQVNIDNSIDGLNTVLIIAKSPTISLDGYKHNVFYKDQTVSDIIGSILQRYPITLGSMESTKGTPKFIVQYRETDYGFIMRLAGSNGKFAFYDGKEFRLTKANGSNVEELVWRESLGSFSYGLGTAAFEHNAKVYNYEQKKEYAQDTKSLPPQSALSTMSKMAPDAAKNIYTDSGVSVSSKIVPDTQTLDEMLQNEKNSVLGKMIDCLGQSIIPKVMAGHCLKVKGMDKLDGTFWIKSVRHIFTESGKYHNTFECTPLDIAFPPIKSSLPPFTELQSAEVVDNYDPDKLGRIKVKFPWNDSETIWVRFMTLYAGKNRGWFCLPEIGDEVLVGYEQGNPDIPIALGALQNKDNPPHSDTDNSQNDVKMFMTKGGNEIYFMDEAGNEQIKILMKDGKNSIIMELGSSTPKITIESKGDISIIGDNVSIESKKDIKIKAGANLNTEGMAIKEKSSSTLDIEGAMVTVKGNPIQLN
ncbi:MAG: phage baseplate assembly protein V [candidate division Zixibacteria bacterium]|nr:phage baseplate assembly protein V [candidate division Zixibacteria bacterium]